MHIQHGLSPRTLLGTFLMLGQSYFLFVTPKVWNTTWCPHWKIFFLYLTPWNLKNAHLYLRWSFLFLSTFLLFKSLKIYTCKIICTLPLKSNQTSLLSTSSSIISPLIYWTISLPYSPRNGMKNDLFDWFPDFRKFMHVWYTV